MRTTNLQAAIIGLTAFTLPQARAATSQSSTLEPQCFARAVESMSSGVEGDSREARLAIFLNSEKSLTPISFVTKLEEAGVIEPSAAGNMKAFLNGLPCDHEQVTDTLYSIAVVARAFSAAQDHSGNEIIRIDKLRNEIASDHGLTFFCLGAATLALSGALICFGQAQKNNRNWDFKPAKNYLFGSKICAATTIAFIAGSLLDIGCRHLEIEPLDARLDGMAAIYYGSRVGSDSSATLASSAISILHNQRDNGWAIPEPFRAIADKQSLTKLLSNTINFGVSPGMSLQKIAFVNLESVLGINPANAEVPDHSSSPKLIVAYIKSLVENEAKILELAGKSRLLGKKAVDSVEKLESGPYRSVALAAMLATLDSEKRFDALVVNAMAAGKLTPEGGEALLKSTDLAVLSYYYDELSSGE